MEANKRSRYSEFASRVGLYAVGDAVDGPAACKMKMGRKYKPICVYLRIYNMQV